MVAIFMLLLWCKIRWLYASALPFDCSYVCWSSIALRLMTWTNNFSKTFLIFASLIPFFRLIIPEKCFYQWILCHNFVYMKKFPWFLSFELGARQACDRRHRTMGTVHSGKISHLTWTFTKKYWAVLGCTGLYWAVLGHLRYLLGNVQVKWRILPLCIVLGEISFMISQNPKKPVGIILKNGLVPVLKCIMDHINTFLFF